MAFPFCSDTQLPSHSGNLELAAYNRDLVKWKVEDDIYRKHVLSPEISVEDRPGLAFGSAPRAGPEESGFLSNGAADWRRPLWENVYPRIRREADPLSAARVVVRFLRERVTVVPDRIEDDGVRAVWERGLTDAAGFERIYVAALRSVGIPARFDGSGQAELFKGKWQPAPRPLLMFLAPAGDQRD